METGDLPKLVQIPADIEQAATRIAGEYMGAPISCAKLYKEVALALLAERERCAEIATEEARECIAASDRAKAAGQMQEMYGRNAGFHSASTIARAILS